jgi:hypothetical protein
MVGLRPSFSAQVRSHGKPGQVGEPGAPVRFLRVLLGHKLRRSGPACGSSRQGFFLGFLLASVVALSLSSVAAVLLLAQEGSIGLTASFMVV